MSSECVCKERKAQDQLRTQAGREGRGRLKTSLHRQQPLFSLLNKTWTTFHFQSESFAFSFFNQWTKSSSSSNIQDQCLITTYGGRDKVLEELKQQLILGLNRLTAKMKTALLSVKYWVTSTILGLSWLSVKYWVTTTILGLSNSHKISQCNILQVGFTGCYISSHHYFRPSTGNKFSHCKQFLYFYNSNLLSIKKYQVTTTILGLNNRH